MTRTVSQLLEQSGLKKDELDRFKLPLKGISRIKMDVGLSLDAPHAISWLKADPELLVIGFEPVEHCVQSIRRLLTAEDMAQVRRRFVIIQCALSEESGVARFFITKDFGTSSLEEPLAFETQRIETVDVFRLDDIVDQLDFAHIDRIDYLKTDCQGHDLKVLKGARECLSKVALVTCEAWAPGYQLKKVDQELQIRRFLRKLGFINVNRGSALKIWLSSLLHNTSQLSWFRSQIENFSVRQRQKLKLAPQSQGTKLTEFVSAAADPTYLNIRFGKLYDSGSITYYQEF